MLSVIKSCLLAWKDGIKLPIFCPKIWFQ